MIPFPSVVQHLPPTSMATPEMIPSPSSISLNTGDVVSINAVYGGGAGKDSVWIVNGASTAALIDGGVGNDFLSLGGLSGTSSLLGGVGEDTITVAGTSTQWLVDGGDDAMTPLPSPTLLSAPQLKAAWS